MAETGVFWSSQASYIFIFDKYINAARRLNPKFTAESEDLLRRYFLVLRRVHPQNMSIHVLPLL